MATSSWGAYATNCKLWVTNDSGSSCASGTLHSWSLDYDDCSATTIGSRTARYITSNPSYTITLKDMEWSSPNTALKIGAGKKELELPDGAKLIVDDLGNYRIEDKDAQVTYKANRIREFSPYLNASDMLAKFVEYVGSIGVKRSEVMGLPIHLFIAWLVIEAAQKDGDAIPSDIVPVERDPMVRLAIKPKCLACGRYIKRLHYQHRFPFCSPDHGAIYVARNQSNVPRLPAVSQASVAL